MKKDQIFFVFDVESIGLHGEGFAVGGGVYGMDGACRWDFRFSCPPRNATGAKSDRAWVENNIPPIPTTHNYTWDLRQSFWEMWLTAKGEGAIMAADCSWPVESGFLAMCVSDFRDERAWQGPYPLIDIGSVILARGGNPLQSFDRLPDEMPIHDPLCDARQSARILIEHLQPLLEI